MRLPNGSKFLDIFRQDTLSPFKITLQIVLLQIFYYFTASVLFFTWSKLEGHSLDFKNWLFSFKYIDFTNAYGLTLSFLWLLTSLICVIFLTVIVGRSKLAWDFGITVHAINLIIVLLHTYQVPTIEWFLLQFLSSLILVFLGTWTSRWRELRDTFFEGMVEVSNIPASSDNINSSNNTADEYIRLKDLESLV